MSYIGHTAPPLCVILNEVKNPFSVWGILPLKLNSFTIYVTFFSAEKKVTKKATHKGFGPYVSPGVFMRLSATVLYPAEPECYCEIADNKWQNRYIYVQTIYYP